MHYVSYLNRIFWCIPPFLCFSCLSLSVVQVRSVPALWRWVPATCSTAIRPCWWASPALSRAVRPSCRRSARATPARRAFCKTKTMDQVKHKKYTHTHTYNRNQQQQKTKKQETQQTNRKLRVDFRTISGTKAVCFDAGAQVKKKRSVFRVKSYSMMRVCVSPKS